MSVSSISAQTSNPMLSAQTSNIDSQILIAATAFGSATISLAAYLLNFPMGLQGGALFGATQVLVQVPLRALTTRLFNLTDPRPSQASIILTIAIHILGGLAAAWASLTLAGFPLTLAHTISLGAVSLFFNAPLAVAVQPLGWGFAPL